MSAALGMCRLLLRTCGIVGDDATISGTTLPHLSPTQHMTHGTASTNRPECKQAANNKPHQLSGQARRLRWNWS